MLLFAAVMTLGLAASARGVLPAWLGFGGPCSRRSA